MRPADEQIWQWLSEVSDPEIPVISVIDLGIVRALRWTDELHCEVTITPTYSGCPAMQVITENIQQVLQSHGVQTVSVKTQLSPAWTTDWMSESGKQKMQAFGIAPPAQQASQIAKIDVSALISHASVDIPCPQCASLNTRLISQFGSTSCKALYRCTDCLEPFDYFKPH